MAGKLWGWGRNQGTLLAIPRFRSSPVQTITFATDWSVVACTTTSVSAIKKDGTLWSWGNNSNGELGNNSIISTDSPVQTIGTNWSQVSAGRFHVCAIKTDGTLWGWGLASLGTLGNNLIYASSPVQTVAYGTNWGSVSCGSYHTSSIKTDGSLWLWGYNIDGQLGDNTTTNRSSPVQTITFGTNWSYVACGGNHAAAIKTDGTLWTWGRNNNGQLGDNTTTNKSSPVQTIAGGTNWSKVACGYRQTAAIKTDGTLWTWGRNSYGSLGDDTRTDRSSPVQTIALGTNWSSVSVGYREYIAATKTDGTLWLWGNNAFIGISGWLGDNTSTPKSSPVQTVAGGTNWSSVYCGDKTTMAIKKDGTLWGWGDNTNGEIGDKTIYVPIPTIIDNVNNWASMTNNASYDNSIFMGAKTDGTIWVWGTNSYGQLGDNTIVSKFSPVQLPSGINSWSIISAGTQHTAGIQSDGSLWAWGRNIFGQLGDNTLTNKSSPIQIFSELLNWSAVSCGTSHSMGLKKDGTLWTWGANARGQLGINVSGTRSSPIQTVTGGTNWTSIYAGNQSCAAIKSDTTLWVWGFGLNGQLGQGNSTNRSSPVQFMLGTTGWSKAAWGSIHFAALKTDGSLWLSGSNSNGELGDNTNISRSSPVQTIVGGNEWADVFCGSTYTIAKKKDGSFWSWGSGINNLLGDNTFVSKSSPIQIVASNNNWYQLNVISTGNFLIVENNPTQLGMNTQPFAGYNSNNLLVQPKVNLNDSSGNLSRLATNSVTVAVQSGTATLSGTTTVTAVDGVATFTDLVLTGSGNVTLRFTSSGLTQVDSSSFTVSLTLPIIPKRSEASGKLPTSGQLNIGELAINIDDKKGFIKKSDGTVLNIFNGKVADGGTF